MNIPRGIRNNNPLNIRHGKSQWKGMKRTQTDPGFVQFTSMEYGYRAAFVLLRTYREKHGCDTIRKIVSRWAPENENHTEAYIRNVSRWTGIGADKQIARNDANSYIMIVAAMSRVESLTPLPPGEDEEPTEEQRLVMEAIVQGYRMV